ncbi:MAG: pirin family protein [Alphaproteobacteria bacterium]|nr:MAG: pirin family protein [Alphaproteobacteria bacterium]
MNAAIETSIVPRTRDLGGGFEVRRVLPSGERRTVGPFVFFDQMGPTVLPAGRGLDVRPHPHIGLATVTYLFDGEIIHRDSLGTVQPIRPGAVNWMTAGRGIVHSERTPPEFRTGGGGLFGIQTWVGLPKDNEEADPAFAHHPEDALPVLDGDGKRVRVIAGAFHGARSPLVVFSETVYVDAALAPDARLEIPPEYEERAVYIAEGRIEIGGDSFEEGRMLVFRAGDPVTVTAGGPARVLLLGGAPLDGPRHLWWNFVSSSTERIEQAKADWREGRFPQVPGETEFTPLPEDRSS